MRLPSIAILALVATSARDRSPPGGTVGSGSPTRTTGDTTTGTTSPTDTGSGTGTVSGTGMTTATTATRDTATTGTRAFSQISAGDYHTCGLRADGFAACWGDLVTSEP
jgi:hypothetical protein